jgi:hypothetical protein
MRWPANRDMATGGMTPSETFTGLGFARAISLWRTAYSSIAQARGDLPAEVGAITWIAPYAPHYSSFMPIYANANFTPSAISQGTQYKLDKSVNFWIHSLTSNYLSRFYRYSIGDTVQLQQEIEDRLFKEQAEVEADAAKMLKSVESTLSSVASGSSKIAPSDQWEAESVRERAVKKLAEFHEKAGDDINKSWWDYFWFAITKYRDIYQVIDFHAENFMLAYNRISYSRRWMEQAGYWGAPGTPSLNRTSVPIYPINVMEENTPQELYAAYPDGFDQPYPTMLNPKNPDAVSEEFEPASAEVSPAAQRTLLSDFLLVGVGAVMGVLATYMVPLNRRRGYTAIQDNRDDGVTRLL